MKRIFIFILLLLTAGKSFSRTFYVTGAGNNSLDGLSPANAWQTIGKVATFNFSAFDTIRFNRSEIFYGSWIINQPYIFVGAYGTGANPIISGFTDAGTWSNLGGNIWETASAVSNLQTCMMVTVGGVNTPMGRYPNSDAAAGGYLLYQAISSTKIKCGPMAGNWYGADVVIRLNRYAATRKKITAQNGDTLTFSATTVYTPTSNYGMVIVNDARTLDKQGEWYYNPANGKVKMYSSGAPAGVKISTIDTLITIAASNVKFDSIDLTGANVEAFAKPNNNSYSNVSIKNFNISFSGRNAINFRVGNNLNLVAENGIIINTNVNAIQAGAGCQYASIKNNLVRNTGTDITMIPVDLNTSFFGINTAGKGTLIESNIVKNTGYVGIGGMNDSTVIRYNLVDSFSNVLDDGSGIYFNNGSGNTTTFGIQIKNNIVLNGKGAPYGAGATLQYYGEGIYLDDNSNGIELSGNTVANCAKDGFLIHNARNSIITGNTSYNNLFQFATSHNSTGQAITNLTVKNNFFVAVAVKQYSATFYSNANDYANIGTLDSNVYARPILDSATMKLEFPFMGWGYRTLQFWKSFASKDPASKKSDRTITSTSQIELKYNASSSPLVYNFTGTKADLTGTIYSGTVSIPGFSSIVLIDTNAIPPVPASASDKLTGAYNIK